MIRKFPIYISRNKISICLIPLRIIVGFTFFMFYVPPSASSQVIASWQNNNSGAIQNIVSGLSASSLVRYNGITTPVSPCAVGFTSSGGSFQGPLDTATSGYIGFTLTPQPGKILHVSRLVFGISRDGLGPTFCKTCYSTDGISWIERQASVPSYNCITATNPMGNWNSLNIMATNTLYFRIYGFYANGAFGRFQIVQLSVEGSLCEPIQILQQPTNRNINFCDSVHFKVSAGGTAIVYQWRALIPGVPGTININNGADYEGVNSSELIVKKTELKNGYRFYCSVTGDCPPGSSSDTVTLTVNPSSHPAITTCLQTKVCGNDSVINILVQNFYDVAAGSIQLKYDTAYLTYMGVININPLLSSFLYNNTFDPDGYGKLIFTWASVETDSIGSGILFGIKGHFKPGICAVSWNHSPDTSYYTNINGCKLPVSFSDGLFNIDQPPVRQDMSGGGVFCQGHAGKPVGLTGSQPGMNYQLERNGTIIGGPVTGTGSSISFGNQSLAGTYTVLADKPSTGCSETMNGQITLEYDQVPLVFHVSSNGSSNCALAPGREIVLDNSEPNVNYSLERDGVTLSTLPGTGGVLSFGYQSASGAYTVTAADSCTSVTMDGSLVIHPLPAQFTVMLQGSSTYCQGSSTGPLVTLNGSETGVSYILLRNGTEIGTVNGTGSPILFQTVSWGTYTVKGRNLATLCENDMIGLVVVTEVPAAAADAGPPAFTCGNSLFTVSDAVAHNYDSVKWVSSGSGVLANGNSLTPSYTPSAIDISNGLVLLTLTAYGHFPCENVDSPKTLYIHHASQAEAGPSAAICAGQTYTIAGASYLNGTALWTSSGNGSFINNGSASPTYFPSINDQAAGSVWLSLTVSGPPPCVPVRDSLLLTIHPSPNVVMTPFPDSICSNLDSVPLNNGSPAGGTYSGPGVLNNIFYPAITGPGTFNISYSYTNGYGCSGGMTQPVIVKERYTISGNVTYANSVSTPLDSVVIKLRNDEGYIVDTLLSGVSGQYKFKCLGNDNYSYITNFSDSCGGINATDALFVARYSLGLIALSTIQAKAAEVNNFPPVNAGDALLICKYTVNLIQSFQAGKWVSEDVNLQLSGSSIVKDFKALCVGDVNGSYVPTSRQAPSVSLENHGVVNLGSAIVNIPVLVRNDLELGAVSLDLDFPENDFEIIDVTAPHLYILENQSDNSQALQYNVASGKLRIACYNVVPRFLGIDDTLFILKIRNKSGKKSPEAVGFELGNNSEFADSQGQVLSGIIVAAPRLANDSVSAGGILHEENELYLGPNCPNPFSHLTEIEYRLPDNGEVTFFVLNSLGKILFAESEGRQMAGNHVFKFNDPGLAPGIYFYRIELQTKGIRKSKTRMMVLEK